jgi:hypothetical protein
MTMMGGLPALTGGGFYLEPRRRRPAPLSFELPSLPTLDEFPSVTQPPADYSNSYFQPPAGSVAARGYETQPSPVAGAERRGEHPRFRSLVDAGPEAIENELAEYIRNSPPEDISADPRTWWQTALETLDLPRNLAANLVFHKLFGVQPSSKEEFAGLRKIYGSDVIRAMGWEPESTIGKVGHFLSGLLLDVVTDPLAWATGLAGVGRATFKTGAKSAAQLAPEIARARQFGKGLTVAGRHVRPEALDDLLLRTRAIEQPAELAQRTVQELPETARGFVDFARGRAVDLAAEGLPSYGGRWGLGLETHAMKTLPLGHLVLGPALIAGKAATTAGQIGGQVLGKTLEKIPRFGRPLATAVAKPIELLARVADVPLDLAGMASDWLGTPFKALPNARAFREFRTMPIIGAAIDKADAAIKASQSAQQVMGGLSRAGASIREQAAKIGIGPKTPLMALALKHLEQAKGRVRRDQAGVLRDLQQAVADGAKQSGLTPDTAGAVSVAAIENLGVINKAIEGGDPFEVRDAVESLRAQLMTYLDDAGHAVDTVMESTDAVMRKVFERLGDDAGPRTTARPVAELLPRAPSVRSDFREWFSGSQVVGGRKGEVDPRGLRTTVWDFSQVDPEDREAIASMFESGGQMDKAKATRAAERMIPGDEWQPFMIQAVRDRIHHMAHHPARPAREEFGRIVDDDPATAGWKQWHQANAGGFEALEREAVKRIKRAATNEVYVARQGEPKVLFHGTPAGDIQSFDPKMAKPGLFNDAGEPAFYLAADPGVAGDSATIKDGQELPGAVYPVFASIKKPFRLPGHIARKEFDEIFADLKRVMGAAGEVSTDIDAVYRDFGKQVKWSKSSMRGHRVYEQLVRAAGSKRRANEILKARGYDGIFHVGKQDGEVWVAFDAKQIKSAWSARFEADSPELIAVRSQLPPDPVPGLFDQPLYEGQAAELLPRKGPEGTVAQASSTPAIGRLRDFFETWTDESAARGAGAEPRRPLKDGDVIISRIGGWVQRYRSGDALPRNFLVVRIRPEMTGRYDPGFVEASLRASLARRGTAEQAVRLSELRQLPVTGQFDPMSQRRLAETARQADEALRAAERMRLRGERLRRQALRDVPELMPRPPKMINKATGLKAASSRILKMHDELADVLTIDATALEGGFDSVTNLGSLLLPGYKFRSRAELDVFTREFSEQEIRSFKAKGLLGVMKKGEKGVPAEDIVAKLTHVAGRRDPYELMAAAMREHAGLASPAKIEAVLEFARKNPEMVGMQGAYDVALYEAALDGERVGHLMTKGAAPQEIDFEELVVGAEMEIAGRVHIVESVDEQYGALLRPLADGRDVDVRPGLPILIDSGTMRAPAEASATAAARAAEASYRSQEHARVAKAVRDAGIPEPEAQLFDMAIEDLHEDHLARIDVQAAQKQFAGSYRMLGNKAEIILGRGLAHATEPLHEIGHFAYDYVFNDAERKTFSDWWAGMKIEDRVRIFERHLGDRDLAEYVAGGALTPQQADALKLSSEQLARHEASPQREGFAQYFAHYAITRKAGDPRMTKMFERAMDWLRQLWSRLRFGGPEKDDRILRLIEQIFDPTARPRDIPEKALDLELQGITAQRPDFKQHYQAGKNGHAQQAKLWASKAIGPAAGEKLRDLAGDRPIILVPVPSATKENHTAAAMAERLALVVGRRRAEVRPVLASHIKMERVPAGILRKAAHRREFTAGWKWPDIPDDALVILVDDAMDSGATLRDAAVALANAGIRGPAAVVGAVVNPRRSPVIRWDSEWSDRAALTRRIQPLKGASESVADHERRVFETRERLANAMRHNLEDLTEQEAGEIVERLNRGSDVDDIVALMDQARSADPPAELGDLIRRTLTPLDDVPRGNDRFVQALQDAMAAGELPGDELSRTQVVAWLKGKDAAERGRLVGYGKIGGRRQGQVAAEIDKALLRLGHGIRGGKWERILDRLEGVDEGRPVGGLMYKLADMIARDSAGHEVLTEFGSDILTAMRATIEAGGTPEVIARLRDEAVRLKAEWERARRYGQPFPADKADRLKLKQRVLKRLGRGFEDDQAFIDAMRVREATEGRAEAAGGAGGVGPPAAVIAGAGGRLPKRLNPEDLFAAPIADMVRRMVALEQQTLAAERAAGLKTADITATTQRGIGYVPHYIGDGRTILGKSIRRRSMAWENAWRELEGVEKRSMSNEAYRRTAYQRMLEAIDRENAARSRRGEDAIPIPEPGEGMAQAIAEILDDPRFRDMADPHRSMLRRLFLRESTIAEINGLYEQTGVAFMTDPVRLWVDRRYAQHMAVGGADFLREAVQQGLREGWAVKVKDFGSLPDGFARISDSRFGNIAKGYAFSEDVAREFRRFTNQMDRPHALLKALDFATSMWRTMVLGVFPYTTTNLLSGVFQANQFDAFKYDTWAATRKLMEDYHLGRNLDRKVGNYVKGLPADVRDLNLEELWELLSIEHGELGRGLYGIEMEQGVQRGFRTEWGFSDAARSTWDPRRPIGENVAHAMLGIHRDPGKVRGVIPGWRFNLGESAYFKGFRAINVAVEDWMALSFMLERLRRGDDLAMAISKKRLALNQSADMTDFDKKTFRRIFPFWGWMKGNAILQFKMAMARPEITALIPRIRGNIESAFAGEDTLPPSLRPRHVAEELGTQLSTGERPDFLNLTRLFPVKELGTTPLAGVKGPGATAEAAVQGLNPFLKGVIEGALNRDFYWDKPIVEYEGQQKEWLGVAMSPHAKRLARMVRPLNLLEQVGWRGVPTSVPEASASAGQFLGLRLFPVDVARQSYEQQRQINDRLGAVMRDFSRARREAERGGRDWRTDPDVQRLSETYRTLRQQRDALPLPVFRERSAEGRRQSRQQRAELRDYALAG